jgi:hypothetical protein
LLIKAIDTLIPLGYFLNSIKQKEFYMHRGFISQIISRFLILWFPFCLTANLFAQQEEIVPDTEESSSIGTAYTPVNAASNAVLEGIQISSEPGKEAGENIITCYFIFRDKPSSYFYEIKRKQNKLVFEFNDTQKGTSPIPSQKQSPLESFEIEQRKIDVNKEVKGLNPEYHDQLCVTFNLSAIPQIQVTDEYNVISFSFKWSSDPSKLNKYIAKEEKAHPALIGSVAGGGVLLLGVAGYLIWKFLNPPGPEPELPLDTTDLPHHVPFQIW